MTLSAAADAPVWVLQDRERPDDGGTLALAGRLGFPYRRVLLQAWPGEGGVPEAANGEGPALVISVGARAGARALTLRARFGARLLHCSRHANALMPFDILVRPGMRERPPAPRIVPALGPLHVVSPALLERARALWAERLAHLPRPRIALLLRPGAARPIDAACAGALAARLAALAASRGGAVTASVDRRAGRAATAAVAQALGRAMHVLYRSDEPGEDPTIGFLAMADAVIVAGASPHALSEAAAADAPVFADPLGDGTLDGRRLLRTLLERDDVRLFTGDLAPWRRRRLDEAGRVAASVRVLLAEA